jgi:very-short-patch-repair endonuclease
MDGPLHRAAAQRMKDACRDAELRALGFRTLRFDETAALGSILLEIRRALSLPPLPAPD